MTYREVPIGEAQREMIGDRIVIQLPTPIRSAEVQRFSPTAALLILHAQHCRAAVIGAFEGLRDYEVHQRVLAELCIYYDCRRQFKIDHLCQLNFDQGSKAGCLAPGCG